uniref:MGC114656 protein n=1 Tax=Xenopus laevis TaxID=8355 RepID=Q4KLX2_XENLA|nr:MGC114656 protein [Xenopus laevis]
MADTLEFNDIYQEVKGSMNDGRLRLSRAGLMYKNNKTGKVENISAADIAEVVWRRVALGHGIKLLTNGGHVYKYDGFRETEYDKLFDYFKSHFSVELVEKDLCVKGWNWGSVRFGGQLLSFDIGDQPAFELPLSNVSQCTTGKNEVTLEFHQTDDSEVSLMEIRFYVPPPPESSLALLPPPPPPPPAPATSPAPPLSPTSDKMGSPSKKTSKTSSPGGKKPPPTPQRNSSIKSNSSAEYQESKKSSVDSLVSKFTESPGSPSKELTPPTAAPLKPAKLNLSGVNLPMVFQQVNVSSQAPCMKQPATEFPSPPSDPESDFPPPPADLELLPPPPPADGLPVVFFWQYLTKGSCGKPTATDLVQIIC